MIGDIDDYKKFKVTYSHAFVAVGNNELRLALIQVLENAGFNVPNIIHSRAILSRYTSLSN